MPKSGSMTTVAEYAAAMGVDRKTVLRWISTGRISAVKLPGRTGAYVLDRALLPGEPKASA